MKTNHTARATLPTRPTADASTAVLPDPARVRSHPELVRAATVGLLANYGGTAVGADAGFASHPGTRLSCRRT